MNRLQRSRVNKVIKLLAMAILEEVDEEICEVKKKKLWVRKWIDRRDTLGATNCLLKELALEDPKEYCNSLRMSESCVNFLFSKIHSRIQRKDTLMRCAIPAMTKLQSVLYFLATGCSLRTLTHLFRLGKSSISEFIIEVCEAIYEALMEFIKISTYTQFTYEESNPGYVETSEFIGGMINHAFHLAEGNMVPVLPGANLPAHQDGKVPINEKNIQDLKKVQQYIPEEFVQFWNGIIQWSVSAGEEIPENEF